MQKELRYVAYSVRPLQEVSPPLSDDLNHSQCLQDDAIVAVDGTSVAGSNLSHCISLLQEADYDVELTVLMADSPHVRLRR